MEHIFVPLGEKITIVPSADGVTITFPKKFLREKDPQTLIFRVIGPPSYFDTEYLRETASRYGQIYDSVRLSNNSVEVTFTDGRDAKDAVRDLDGKQLDETHTLEVVHADY